MKQTSAHHPAVQEETHLSCDLLDTHNLFSLGRYLSIVVKWKFKVSPIIVFRPSGVAWLGQMVYQMLCNLYLRSNICSPGLSQVKSVITRRGWLGVQLLHKTKYEHIAHHRAVNLPPLGFHDFICNIQMIFEFLMLELSLLLILPMYLYTLYRLIHCHRHD